MTMDHQHLDDEPQAFSPLAVHIASSDVPLASAPASSPRRRRAATCRTFTIISANPVVPLFAEDLSRRGLMVQAVGTNDVILCQSKAQAQAAQSTADPEGTLIPHTNTAPWPVPTTDQLWATAITFPALLAVTVVNDAPAL